MVALSDVKRWNPAALNEIARTLQQRVQVLTFSGDDFRKLLPVEGWSGPAADNAASMHQGIVFELEKMTAGASAVGKAMAQASDAIPAVQQAIANAEELARKYGYQIADTGTVIDTFCGKPPPDLHPDDRARACQEVTDDIAQALRTAREIDKDLTSTLQRAEHGEFGTGNEATVAAAAADGATDPGLTPLAPPTNGSPSQNAAWWATLSKTEQDDLVRDHPDWLGNLDGLPGAVRSQANLARIPAIRARLQSQLDELNKQADSPLPGEYDLQLIGDQINEIEAKLHSLDTIQTTMAQGDRQLLFLDANPPQLETTVAVGDVDTAQNVAVFTPGFTTTVDGSLTGYDNAMHNLTVMSDQMNKLHGGGSTAAVTWIGYQPPQWGWGLLDPSQSVASPEAAKAGGDSLAKFYNGLGAAHGASNTPLHLTALGHSYGSTTTGFALGHDTPVNDAVLFGSPGQGADHLNVPAGHLYDEKDMGDNLVPALHGTLGPSPYYSPDTMPNYHQLSTDASTTELGQLNSSQGHSGYLDAKSTSLYNMAAIASGHPDLAVNYQPPPPPPPLPPEVHTIPVGVPPVSPPTPTPTPIPAPPGQAPTPPPEPSR